MIDKIKRAFVRTRNYIYDQSIDVKDRSFVLFSVLVLISLYIAIPCGLIMKEPPIATISTLIGAVSFSVFVYFSFKKNWISVAKIILSIVVVCIFLPVMFFTNGGAYGGTPVWLLLGTIYIAMILNGKSKIIMLIMNVIVLAVTWSVGYFFPELVIEFSREGNFFDSIIALYIVGGIEFLLISFQVRINRKDEEGKNLQRLFAQTATALVNAIDAKDNYTHGHSARVAEYSKKIAELSGKSPAECEEIYYAALLHDVGKIGIDNHIINKKGKLNDEEYRIIKQHPIFGSQILSSISEYPSLLIGARHHHERYDGKGYPDKLKGEDIPEIARIIAVADAYDAMTSKRSYRATIPQQSVREEIVKGSGTQFDPKYAKIMQHLIDMDTEYEMKEKDSVQELAGRNELVCDKCRDDISEGIYLGPEIKKIRLKCVSANYFGTKFKAAMILFDSLDGRYHETQREVRELNYFEYAELWLDGQYECKGARKIVVEESKSTATISGGRAGNIYNIEAVKVKDHVQIRIDNMIKVLTITVALPDSTRYAYIGLTGENCHIYDVSIATQEGKVPEDYIPRIAEEVSFIDGPVGDVPNIQVDGYRSASTTGVPVTDGMKITFHSKSLPTARLIWHCPYLDLFYSPDKNPYGEGYKEYALIRLDGENWEAENIAKNKVIVNIGDDFKGWDTWKDANKEGFDCTVTFKIEDDKIITTTENMGIALKNITTLLEKPEELYVSLTGDQCAITNIHFIR